MPVRTTRPLQAKRRSTAFSKVASRRVRTSRIAWASILSTRRAVSRLIARSTFARAWTVPSDAPGAAEVETVGARLGRRRELWRVVVSLEEDAVDACGYGGAGE